MIIKLITHKRNKDGTGVIHVEGLTKEHRRFLMDLEEEMIHITEGKDYSSQYDQGIAEGIKIGIERVHQAALALKAEDGCQK